MTFRAPGRVPIDHRSSRRDRIDHIGLAVPATDLTVRPVHLNHLNTLTREMPRQPDTVGTGALHPDLRQRTEPAQVGQQRPVTTRRRREGLNPEHRTELVTRRSDMNIRMRVHTPNDIERRRCNRGHAGPLSRMSRAGTHSRRSDRTGTGPLDQAPTRSLPPAVRAKVFSRPVDGSPTGQPRKVPAAHSSQAGRENVTSQHPCRSRALDPSFPSVR